MSTATNDAFLICKHSIAEDSQRRFCFSMILFNRALN